MCGHQDFTSLPTYSTQDHSRTVQSVRQKVYGGERSLSKPPISPRTGSSHQSLGLTFLFPRCTSIYNLILNHPNTVFGGALSQIALIPFF